MFIWKSIKPFIFSFILVSIKEKKSVLVPGIILLFLFVSLPHLQGQNIKDGGRSELGEGLQEGMVFLRGKLQFFYRSRKIGENLPR